MALRIDQKLSRRSVNNLLQTTHIKQIIQNVFDCKHEKHKRFQKQHVHSIDLEMKRKNKAGNKINSTFVHIIRNAMKLDVFHRQLVREKEIPVT